MHECDNSLYKLNIDKLTSYAGHRRLVVGLVEMWCSKISSKLTTGFLVAPKSSADSVYSAWKLSLAHIISFSKIMIIFSNVHKILLSKLSIPLRLITVIFFSYRGNPFILISKLSFLAI